MKGNEDLIQGFDGRALILHGDVDHVVGGRTLLNMLLYLALCYFSLLIVKWQLRQ